LFCWPRPCFHYSCVYYFCTIFVIHQKNWQRYHPLIMKGDGNPGHRDHTHTHPHPHLTPNPNPNHPINPTPPPHPHQNTAHSHLRPPTRHPTTYTSEIAALGIAVLFDIYILSYLFYSGFFLENSIYVVITNMSIYFSRPCHVLSYCIQFSAAV
jgi:hypothetical protein